MRLHVDVVTAPSSSPHVTLVMLHGILGTGANLRTLAKRVVEAAPRWQVALMDLRAHGASQGHDGPDTVQNAAADVVETAQTLGVPLRGVLGHSFGGKVALAMPAAGLEHLFTVDSTPGARRDFHGSESTLEVFEQLLRMHGPWPRREDFVAELERAGHARALGQWLAMNLRRDGEVFRFGLDLQRIRALLDSYFELDLWPVLEGAGGPLVHLVIGARSSVYSAEDRARAVALEPLGRVSVDVLPAGHWVHVDDFEGLVATVTKRLR